MFAISRGTLAANLNVTCDKSGCDSSPKNGAVFNELDVKPLDEYTRTLEACNTADESLTFAMEVSKFKDSDPSIGGVMTLSVFDPNQVDPVIGPITFTDLNDSGYLLIGSIESALYRFRGGAKR